MIWVSGNGLNFHPGVDETEHCQLGDADLLELDNGQTDNIKHCSLYAVSVESSLCINKKTRKDDVEDLTERNYFLNKRHPQSLELVFLIFVLLH